MRLLDLLAGVLALGLFYIVSIGFVGLLYIVGEGMRHAAKARKKAWRRMWGLGR